jgi:hypothetical protein
MPTPAATAAGMRVGLRDLSAHYSLIYDFAGLERIVRNFAVMKARGGIVSRCRRSFGGAPPSIQAVAPIVPRLVSPERSLIIARTGSNETSLDMLSFATFLYENEAETGPLLHIPEEFTDEE